MNDVSPHQHQPDLHVEIARIVRCCIDLGKSHQSSTTTQKNWRHNTFAGWPSMMGIGVFVELQVTCRGLIDPMTGYLLNISHIDDAVRSSALPIIRDAVLDAQSGAELQPWHLLPQIIDSLQLELHESVESVQWNLTPYYSITMHASDLNHAILRQQFEFAAAHRLHVPRFSDEQNRRVFGRCNNPKGHGHNYRLQVAVKVPLDSANEGALTLPAIERIVDETIIKRFDHKHLNLDTAEFADLNPSVENIARVCYQLLAEPLNQAGGRLQQVTVWETEKTSCTYPAAARSPI